MMRGSRIFITSGLHLCSSRSPRTDPTMSLLTIPNELLLLIARFLLHCPTCHCQHISWHLSALSRCTHHLHASLASHLLSTASPLQILHWSIANTRHDTIALALSLGADPNSAPRPNPYLPTRATLRIGTPTEIAIRLRVHSPTAALHARKLESVAILLAAGGTCTASSLTTCARYGDLDLLALCLARVTFGPDGLRTLLLMLARSGHVEGTRMLVAAGAAVNSVGTYPARGFASPLWVCWDAPVGVLRVLLEAGADPTWRDQDGVSVVQNMRSRGPPGEEVERKITLLVEFGAVDEPASWYVMQQWTPTGRRRPREYRGWTDEPVDANDGPVASWVVAGLYGGCECLTCPLGVTRGAYSSRGYEARGGGTFGVGAAEAGRRGGVGGA